VTKRISARTREQAALLCQFRASNPTITTFVAVDIWGDDEVALVLAFDAWDAACSEDFRTNQQHWAAGESLLRTGWSP
jgi:hypothetical protein